MSSSMSTNDAATSENHSDLLADITQQGGEFVWISRTKHFYESASASKTVADVNAAVLTSAAVRVEIAAETARRSRSGDPKAADAVLKAARQILAEMEHNFQLDVVRAVGYALLKAIKGMYKSIFVNMNRLREVREACERDARVVFLPTHCSYMDFLLLSVLCYHAEVPLPAVCAGEDFRASAILGGVLRRCGAFFIRRTFGNDRLYWAIFSEYVQMHIVENLRPVEFFVEGMRSRSGKNLSPKTGFLQTVLEPFFASKVFDILLVPVTINYDRLLEENLFARELLGTPKPKETASGLFKARDLMHDNFGNIYVTFASPISVREHFANCAASHQLRTRYSFLPSGSAFEWSEAARAAVRRLSHVIIDTHRQNFVLTVWPLICHVMLREKYEKLERRVDDIRILLKKLSVNVKILSTSLDQDIDTFLALHKNTVSRNGETLAFNSPANESVGERMARRLVIANYANALVAQVAEVAMASISIARHTHDDTQLNVNDAHSDFRFLLEMFGREFIIIPNESNKAFKAALERLRQASVLSLEGGIITVLDDTVFDEIRTMIEHWVECYVLLMYVSESVLSDHPAISNGDFVAMSRRQAIRLLTAMNAGDWCVRCLSADVIRNVFALIKERATNETKNVNLIKINALANRLGAFVPEFTARLSEKSDTRVSPKL